MVHKFRVLLAFMRIYVQDGLTYKVGGMMWIINGSIGNLISMFIWTIASPDAGEIVTYFLAVILIGRLTQSWAMEKVGDSIKDGTLSNTLLKPYHYVVELICRDQGWKSNRVLSLIPLIIILFFLFRQQMHIPSPNLVLLSIPAIFLGYAMNFLLECCFGLLTHWTGDIDGVYRTYQIFKSIATGSLIPIFLFPAQWQHVLSYTPFRYILPFPIEIALGQINSLQLINGYTTLLIWVVILAVIFWILDKVSTKKYSANGG